MKLGLTTKHYPNHGTVLVPCDSNGGAFGDNVISVEVSDGIVTVKYCLDESLKFGGAKGMNSGYHRFSVDGTQSNKHAKSNAEMKVTFETTDLQALLSDFIHNTLPVAVSEIVRDEMHKQFKAAAMSRVE